MNKINNYFTTKAARCFSLIFAVFLMGLSFSSCQKEKNEYNLGKKAYILSLDIDGFPGVIDVQRRTIDVNISADEFDLTNVEPNIKLPEGADYIPKGPVDMTEPVDYTVTFGEPSSEVTYKVSATVSEISAVSLDANRVFFTLPGNLAVHQQIGGVQGDAFNGGKYFDYIYGWKSDNDMLEWAVDIKHAGNLNVKLVAGLPEEQDGSELEIVLDKTQSQVVTLASTKGYGDFVAQKPVHFTIEEPGRHVFQLKIKSHKDAETEVARIKELLLTGKAAIQASPVALRWRPAAIHCNWQNSSQPQNIITAIHEVTIKSTQYDVYCPITSSFGYFGSTWVTKENCFGGINFSLWSFGAGLTPPPTEQFSHLIAVGKGMKIGGFNHEGTGVKPRGENPYSTMKGQNTQVLALRKIPGKPYNIYYSYYWDTNEKEWILYGCGKQYNEKNVSYLWTGAFVEVPGAPEKQRTGHLQREIHHRGWYMDESNQIYPINEMHHGDYDDDGTYREWGVSSDNLFSMKLGGFDPIVKPVKGVNKITTSHAIPEYMAPEKLAVLQKLPIQIEMLEPQEITSSSAIVRYKVDKFGTNPVATIYLGKKDGLTFVPENPGNGGVVRWDSKKTIETTSTDISCKLEGLDPESTYFYRLQIVNDEGEIWAWDSGHFKTEKGSGPIVPVDELTASMDFKAIKGHKSQTGNTIVYEDSYNGSMEIDILVNDIPAGYTLANDIGDLQRPGSVANNIFRGGQVQNMHISLDGSREEMLGPSSKGFGVFVNMTGARKNEGNVHTRLNYEWAKPTRPVDKNMHLFADNYVGYGGWLQYEFQFKMLDKDGVTLKDKNGEDTQATVVIKNMNKNKNAKVVEIPGFTVKTSELSSGKILQQGYDVAAIWREQFGSELPSGSVWQIQYYQKDNLGFFEKVLNEGHTLHTYAFQADSKGKIVRKGNSVDFELGAGLSAGEYAFRFVVKDPSGNRADWKYIIFHMPITIE